jgi:hypothetical protein
LRPTTRELLDKASADQGRSRASIVDQVLRDTLGTQYGTLEPRLQRFLMGQRQP